jgi:hypothetical protein
MKAKGFSKALIYHLQWKVHLRKFLDGQGSFNIAQLSPEDCKFGKWLCSSEAAMYASEQELREIKKVHDKLHKTANRAYGLKMLGNDVVALKELAKMEATSMKLVSLMTTLKAMNRN